MVFVNDLPLTGECFGYQTGEIMDGSQSVRNTETEDSFTDVSPNRYKKKISRL